MKKLINLFLAAALIIASAGVALAEGEDNESTLDPMTMESGAWIEPAKSQNYFDGETKKQYPVLGSSGVFFRYEVGKTESEKPLYYTMLTISVRGDKCYGTSHDSTIIAMQDREKTGYEDCPNEPTINTDAGGKVTWTAGTITEPDSGWVKTDGSGLPGEMTEE
jgi:hypothetical protein